MPCLTSSWRRRTVAVGFGWCTPKAWEALPPLPRSSCLPPPEALALARSAGEACPALFEALLADRAGPDFWRTFQNGTGILKATRHCGAAATEAVRRIGDFWDCGARRCSGYQPTANPNDWVRSTTLGDGRVAVLAHEYEYGGTVVVDDETVERLRPLVPCGETRSLRILDDDAGFELATATE
jgi:hypothetical protein